MIDQRLKRRKKRREKALAEHVESVRLKKMIARAERKAQHQCTDASCSLCDPEQDGDGTWNLPLDI